MGLTIRITGTRLIVGLILGVLLATVLLLRSAMPGPNAVITNRSSFQALLLMPEELRKFPVEQYLARGDWFIYRLSTKRNGRRDWRLHIVVSTAPQAGMWKNAFLAYLEPRGQCIEHVGPQKRWEPRTVYFRSNSKPGVSSALEFKYAEPSGVLYITFAYYEPGAPNRLWGTKCGRFIASILLRIGLPIDAVTQVS